MFLFISVPVQKNQFYEDVHKTLLQIVGDRNFLQLNKVTPYGYRVSKIHTNTSVQIYLFHTSLF